MDFTYLTESQKNEFIDTLKNMTDLLIQNQSISQASYIEKMLSMLSRNKLDGFVECINSAAIWGGAGTVNDVVMTNEAKNKEFLRCLIHLIDLMEKSCICRDPSLVELRFAFINFLNN